MELIHCPRDVADGILVNSVDLCEANPNESVVQAWSRTSRRSTSHRNNTLTNWKDCAATDHFGCVSPQSLEKSLSRDNHFDLDDKSFGRTEPERQLFWSLGVGSR